MEPEYSHTYDKVRRNKSKKTVRNDGTFIPTLGKPGQTELSEFQVILAM